MKTLRITYIALFISVGLILPQIFHLTVGPSVSSIFLPIHFPALLAGLVLGKRDGLIVGLLLPLLSFFFSGMPNALRLPFMIIELCTYAYVGGLIVQKTRNIYLSLICAMLAGRITFFCSALFAFNFLGFGLGGATALITSLAMGVTGAILQIIILPPLSAVIRRGLNNAEKNRRSYAKGQYR